MATTNGTIWDFVDSRIIPPMEARATSEQRIAMIRQFRSRVMRLPYLSSHSRRAARYGLYAPLAGFGSAISVWTA